MTTSESVSADMQTEPTPANDNQRPADPPRIAGVIAAMKVSEDARYADFPLQLRAEIYKKAHTFPNKTGGLAYGGPDYPDTNDEGAALNTVKNTEAALKAIGISLRHDRFTMTDEIMGCVEYNRLNDAAARVIRGALQIVGWFVKKDELWEHLSIIALNNAYDSAIELFDELEKAWDGKPRLESMFATYLKTPDDEYHRYWASRPLAMLIHRVRYATLDYCPPWKYMWVIEGDQNARKSSFLRALGMDKYFEENLELGSSAKDILEQTLGKFIVEFPEMVQNYRALSANTKTMLSRGIDSARLSYDRKNTDRPRKWLACGTTNDPRYLTDATGNVRFIPIACGVTGEEPIDVDAFKKEVLQIWGEAAALERELSQIGRSAFEPPATVLEHARTLQADRYEGDAIHDTLETALSGLDHWKRDYAFVATTDLKLLCGMDSNDRDARAHKAITKAMIALGWRHVPHNARPRIDGRKVSGFERGCRPSGGLTDAHRVIVGEGGTGFHDAILRTVA